MQVFFLTGLLWALVEDQVTDWTQVCTLGLLVCLDASAAVSSLLQIQSKF